MTLPQVSINKANRALIVPRTVGMERLFPEGKPLDQKRMVLRHGLAEYRLLRQIGFDVPNPMALYYHWPSPPGEEPFRVQKVTCSLMTASPRAYNLNGMGTGKTRCTLWSWDFLYENNYCGKMLVVAPLSTLEDVWAKEIFKIMPYRTIEVLHHSNKLKRVEKLSNSKADIFVINHDGIKVLEQELRSHTEIDVLTIDEIAEFSNPNARSKALLKYARGMKWVWGLTGSPMPNEAVDVWMQCQIITPNTVPPVRTHAKSILMDKRGEHKWVNRPGSDKIAYSWMQPAVRFSLDDVTELPACYPREIKVPMIQSTSNVYRAVARELATAVGKEIINATNAGVAMGKLLQISGGWVYSTAKGIIELDVTPRKDKMLELVTSTDGPVVLYCPYLHMQTGLAKFLSSCNLSFEVVNGDIPLKERTKIFRDFQANKFKTLLAHPKCMSHGLTLTASNTVLWWVPSISFRTFEQANGRITRIGQSRVQQIIMLYSSPVEQKIYRMLRNKETAQANYLSLFEEATQAVQ